MIIYLFDIHGKNIERKEIYKIMGILSFLSFEDKKYKNYKKKK